VPVAVREDECRRAGEITEKTDDDARSNRRPIDFIDSPA
jgi:hypothetical protein